MKLILTGVALLSLLISVKGHANTACVGKDLFGHVSGADFHQRYGAFLDQGGNADDIVKIESIDDIVENFGAYRYPTDFKYNGRNRAQWGYKFAVSPDCKLRASFYEYKYDNHPRRNVHHHLVAMANSVVTAGAIFFFHDGNEIEKVVIANRSSQFCPSFESLKIAKEMLFAMGIKRSKIILVDGTRRQCDRQSIENVDQAKLAFFKCLHQNQNLFSLMANGYYYPKSSRLSSWSVELFKDQTRIEFVPAPLPSATYREDLESVDFEFEENDIRIKVGNNISSLFASAESQPMQMPATLYHTQAMALLGHCTLRVR